MLVIYSNYDFIIIKLKIMSKIFATLLLIVFSATACNNSPTSQPVLDSEKITEIIDRPNQEGEYNLAYFASGCFWCVEAIFESLEGVDEVYSGYAGGTTENPNYKQVSYGRTDHAEAVKIFYDPKKISFETLVKVFYGSHDPTTLNRQGPDSGTQYRSIAFYSNKEEKAIVERITKELNKSTYDGKITTEIKQIKKFYMAEDYHQDFERRNPNQSYVVAVSIPRLNRFKAKFPELLKKSSH